MVSTVKFLSMYSTYAKQTSTEAAIPFIFFFFFGGVIKGSAHADVGRVRT